MARRRENYRDINQTLQALREQVIESYPYTLDRFRANNPEELFWLLKSNVTYQLDPPGVELLQTAETLFEDNWHGTPGAGDCDCFTILCLAACMTNNFYPNKIVLAGRTKKAPSHIYSRTFHDGKWYTMDLTQPVINSERYYPFVQELNV